MVEGKERGSSDTSSFSVKHILSGSCLRQLHTHTSIPLETTSSRFSSRFQPSPVMQQPGSRTSEQYNTTGNPQRDSCFGTRPRRESADPRCSRLHRAKRRLNTTDYEYPPWASPGESCLWPPRYLLLLPRFRGFPSPHHRQGRNHILPHPQRSSRAGTSCQSPKTANQPGSLTSNQLAPGLGWLFAALRSVAVWLLTQQPCL